MTVRVRARVELGVRVRVRIRSGVIFRDRSRVPDGFGDECEYGDVDQRQRSDQIPHRLLPLTLFSRQNYEYSTLAT